MLRNQFPCFASAFCIFFMSASVVSSFIASSEKNGGGIAWAEKPISAVSNFAAISEAIRALWLQLVEQAVSDGDKMQLIADKPRLLIRLGQVSLIARQVETALTLGKQAAAIAAVQEAKGDEAWARFLVGRAYLAASEPDLDESEKQLDTALRLATACEA